MRTLIAIVAAGLLLAGCTSHKQTIETGKGPATITESNNNQTVTVQNKEGSFTAGKGAVDAAKIGLPVYPGAANSNNAAYAASSKEGSGQVMVLVSPDPFDKVYGWYKTHMPTGSEQAHMTTSEGSMAMFQIGKQSDKMQKLVEITGGKDKTTIMLTSGTKN